MAKHFNIDIMLPHSDSEWGCEDYCIQDAGASCLHCERYTETKHHKVFGNDCNGKTKERTNEA